MTILARGLVMIEIQQTSIKETKAVNSALQTEEPDQAFTSILQSKLSQDDNIAKVSIKTVDTKNLSNTTDSSKIVLEKLLNALSGSESKKELGDLLKTIGLDKNEQEAILKLLNQKTEKVELSESLFQKNTKLVIGKNSEIEETPKTDYKIDLNDKTANIKDNIQLAIKSKDIKDDVKDVKTEPKRVKTDVDTETKLPVKDIKAFIKLFEHLQKSINKSIEGASTKNEKITLSLEMEKSPRKSISKNEVEKFDKEDQPKVLVQKLQTLTKEISSNIETKIEQTKTEQPKTDIKTKTEQPKIDIKTKTEQPKIDIETKTKEITATPQKIDTNLKSEKKLFTFLEKLVKEFLPEIKIEKPISLPVKQIIEAIKVEPKVIEGLKEQKISPKNEKNLQLLLSLPKSEYKEKIIKSISDDIIENKEMEPADIAVEVAIEKHIETFKNTPILQIKKESIEHSNKKVPEKELVSEKLIQLVPQKYQDNFSKELISNAKNYLEQQLVKLKVQRSEKPTLGSLVKLAVAHDIDVKELTIQDITPKESIQKMVENIFSPKVIPINIRQAQSDQIMISREKNSSSEKTSKSSTHTTPLAQLLNLSEQNIETTIVKTIQTPEQIMNKNTNSTELETLNEELNSTTEKSGRENSELNVKEVVKVEANASSQETSKSMLGHFSTSLKEAVKDYRPPFQRLHMKLNPEKLGSVDVTIIQRGQQLHINISANSTALNIMNTQATELRTQLNSAGFGDASMEFNQQQEGNKEQQKQEQRQQQNRFTNYINNDEESPISSLELVMANYF